MRQLIADLAAEEGVTGVLATHFIEDTERLTDHVGILFRDEFVFTAAWKI